RRANLEIRSHDYFVCQRIKRSSTAWALITQAQQKQRVIYISVKLTASSESILARPKSRQPKKQWTITVDQPLSWEIWPISSWLMSPPLIPQDFVICRQWSHCGQFFQRCKNPHPFPCSLRLLPICPMRTLTQLRIWRSSLGSRVLLLPTPPSRGTACTPMTSSSEIWALAEFPALQSPNGHWKSSNACIPVSVPTS